jgi:hypothetical protein
MTAFFRLALTTAAVVAAIASASPLLALPGAKQSAGRPSSIVKAHDDGDRNGHYYRHRYDHGNVVDAPFAHVESGGRTVVDAPFAHVYSGRRGQHIVAPFVDLWVPR